MSGDRYGELDDIGFRNDNGLDRPNGVGQMEPSA